MQINREDRGGVRIFAPSGRVDSNTSRELEQALLPTFEEGGKVIVDLSQVTYISSAGLRVLLMAAKQSKATGTPMALAGMTKPIQEVFAISGFAKLFTIAPDTDAAIATLGA